MRKNDKFVHVQCYTMHCENQERGRRWTLAVPVSAISRLQDFGIVRESETADPPFVLDCEFDDVALAIPGSFIVKA